MDDDTSETVDPKEMPMGWHVFFSDHPGARDESWCFRMGGGVQHSRWFKTRKEAVDAAWVALGITRSENAAMRASLKRDNEHPMTQLEIIDAALASHLSCCSESELDMPETWAYWAQEMVGHDRASELMAKHYRGEEVEAERAAVDRCAELKADRDRLRDARDVALARGAKLEGERVMNNEERCHQCGRIPGAVYTDADDDEVTELRTRAEKAEAEVSRLLVSLEKNRDEHYRREEKALAEGAGRERPLAEHQRKILEGIIDGEITHRHAVEASLVTVKAELRASQAADEDLSELVQNNKWMDEGEWEQYELERDKLRADAREEDDDQ